MAFFCINCKSAIEATFKACPFCGEPITDFLRRYLEEPIDGKYQIISRLGVGGMGEVYKVLHIHLNQIRVIKLMRPAIAGEENAHERFIREARLATRIQHPNVATLFDFSTLGDGSYYMVWEFIEGTNLAEIIRASGSLSPRYAARLSSQALMGLDAIHKVGIVHRDVSPENMMITRDEDGEERVKIIDLGIAKQWGDTTEDKTKTGMFVGKWKYCSPEHLGMLKKGERIDGRADLYSYGVVMYEMLCGVPPFVADTPHRYLMMHASESPRRFHELDEGTNITAQLEAAVFRALEKDRDKRFATAREFARALDQLIPSLDDEARVPAAVPYSDEPTAERALSRGVPGSMQETATRAGKKSITEESPLPSDEEQKAAYERLTQQQKLPRSVLRAEITPTLPNQELIPTIMSGERLVPHPGTLELEVHPAADEDAAKPSKPYVWIVAAAIVIVLVVVGVLVSRRDTTVPTPATETTATAEATPGGELTVVAPARIGLHAYPWGELSGVKNLSSGENVELAEKLVTPASLELPPGKYELTMKGPDGKPLVQSLELTAGEVELVTFQFRKAAVDEYPDFGGKR
ncbi:MAG: serine/threonine protein kinase [Acidobacteria bacterium]|nr:serine/threonine protein kinase [Acidobacteriota bacterium]